MGEHKHKKKSKKEHKKHKRSKREDQEIDYSDPSLWVEKADEGSPSAEQSAIPTAASNAPTATATASNNAPVQRESWMLDDSFDFASLGRAQEKPESNKPDPDQLKVSERELNPHFKTGMSVDEYPQEKSTVKFGDAGSKWRMMKLKRIREQASDEGRPFEQVALERYGSYEKLQEALDEEEFLGNRSGRGSRKSREGDSSRRYVFTESDTSRQQKFRRPDQDEFGRDAKRRRPDSPSPQEKEAAERLAKAAAPEQPSDPATPVIITQHDLPRAFSEPVMSRDQLNKLSADLMRAKLMGKDNVDELQREYDEQARRFEDAQNGVATEGPASVNVLPTIDSRGRLYDYALKNDSTSSKDRKGKNKERFQGTHDPKTGERLKYGTTDDNMSLMDMLRQEKAGSQAQGNMDLEFANKIATDATFENDLDYMDEKADVMGTRKGLTEQQKRQMAVSDYKRTQQALDRCRYCYHETRPPQCAMVSLGTLTYLALPNVQELVPGHCQIVPLQHVSSMLECDDDVWDEVRNFQKCLIQMFNEQGQGVIFMETVLALRQHRHTAIEVIPVPYGVYEDAPAYFKESILSSGEEWSQHKKLIDTTSRGGFRRAMVKDLPYFHVWVGLDESYGHVIEDEKEFPQWFGKETIAGMLDIGPERWRRPKYHHQSENRARQLEFLKDWEQWDWTASLPT